MCTVLTAAVLFSAALLAVGFFAPGRWLEAISRGRNVWYVAASLVLTLFLFVLLVLRGC
jgi:fumarate reductase subunit D